MIYNDQPYSKIELIVALKSSCGTRFFDPQLQYYRVETYVTNGKDSFIDMFPSAQVPSLLELIYDTTKETFKKFRFSLNEEKIFLDYINTIQPKTISMIELVHLLEDSYNTKIKIYNEERWKTFSTLA